MGLVQWTVNGEEVIDPRQEQVLVPCRRQEGQQAGPCLLRQRVKVSRKVGETGLGVVVSDDEFLGNQESSTGDGLCTDDAFVLPGDIDYSEQHGRDDGLSGKANDTKTADRSLTAELVVVLETADSFERQRPRPSPRAQPHSKRSRGQKPLL